MQICSYLVQSLLNTFYVLSVGLFSWIIVAFCIHFISNSLRKSLVCLLGVSGYIYLTAPGIVLHELSHAVFCLIFQHKIVELKLFSPEGDGTLGYVNHSYDPKSYYQRIGNFFIGTGPVWGGILLLFLLSKILLPAGMFLFNGSFSDNISAFFSRFLTTELWMSWKLYVWFYLVLTVSSHITLSNEDLTGAANGFFMICGIVLFCCVSLGWCGDWEKVLINLLKDFFFSQMILISTTLCLLAILALILKFIPFKRRHET